MVKEKKPTLRYFARFKEDFGYLRAVIRYDGARKYILTPMVVTKAQLQRLESAGHIRIESGEDVMLETRLREYTTYIWKTVNPLIASGGFAAMPSERLTTAILNTKKGEEEKRQQRVNAVADAEFQRKAKEAAERGHELHRLTVKEFESMVKELKATLTPEEYKALWEKGGDDGEL